MIATFLRSKVGLTLMVVLVCAVFFLLSKLKQRRAAEEADDVAALAAVEGKIKPGVEEATLLKRAQETARGRADDARNDRQHARKVTGGYDENGDAYLRRNTPDPIAQHLIENSTAASATADQLAIIVPGLRIRGRPATDEVVKTSPKRNDALGIPMKGTGKDLQPLPLDAAVEPRDDTTVNKPERFVPFGRLIKAELVITLESTQDEMPLVGLIVEPVYNNGKLVIPAGTEVHSMARPDRIRDRIVSVPIWRFVFPREGDRPNGRQITFEGMALDRDDRDSNGFTWGITDGSYGLRGRAIKKGQALEELKLFAAEALKAASGSMMDRQPTNLGMQLEANAKNAALAGGQAVLTEFSERIARELERNGVYIQVPAGKQFYIYPRQVIDPDRAGIPESIAEVE